MSLDKNQIIQWFQSLQDEICSSMEAADGTAKFKTDTWNRAEGGGGRSRIIQNGNVIEKGGVNFSAVWGKLPENIRQALKVNGEEFFASGVSIVMHPINPFVPIIHMNVRYFEIQDSGIECKPTNNPPTPFKGGLFENLETKNPKPETANCWFGGGIDLTPHYIIPDDVLFFHGELKKACDKFNPEYYPKFKQWADDYFFIKHRNETRGVGGIFFDRLTEKSDVSIENRFDFIKEIGGSFSKIYSNLISKNKNTSFNDQNKQWQLLRRGRYVEFNLVYDKGTKFGLDTNGRIESILMSLPPMASWEYDFRPEIDSEEEKTTRFLRKGINWV